VNSIQAIDSKKTVLIIAHRLSTIKHADRIVCVENGKIITFNSFAEYEKEKLSNL
jgi:ABC-type multidrug transport system fused ATPase/permease subunit